MIDAKDTSREAHDRFKGRLTDAICAALDDAGPSGLTDWQLEQRLGAAHESVSGNRRLLVKRGDVCETKLRRKTPKGNEAIVWVLRRYYNPAVHKPDDTRRGRVTQLQLSRDKPVALQVDGGRHVWLTTDSDEAVVVAVKFPGLVVEESRDQGSGIRDQGGPKAQRSFLDLSQSPSIVQHERKDGAMRALVLLFHEPRLGLDAGHRVLLFPDDAAAEAWLVTRIEEHAADWLATVVSGALAGSIDREDIAKQFAYELGRTSEHATVCDVCDAYCREIEAAWPASNAAPQRAGDE